ncbi:DUF4232 domain-containing protein [Streptomyces sp. NPDC053431]|uniref:DUF4232 domain-containing protein n=1 Tax=Streptomyces sp. NPDC053431 TaxID=3365703 RepID=UPI0037D5C9FE
MRTLTRRLALPAAALTAALALTACQSGTGDSAAPTTAPASAATPSQEASTPEQPTAPATRSTPKPTKAAAKSATPAKTSGPSGKQPGGSAADGPARTLCTAENTKVVASKVSRPINHVVLTVTNVGSRHCDALNAPFVGFENSQAPLGILEESKPQAVVGLAPGESAYASLVLMGEPTPDTHARTVQKISVYLTANSGTTVTAPAGTYADDGAAVSYWQRTLEDALVY